MDTFNGDLISLSDLAMSPLRTWSNFWGVGRCVLLGLPSCGDMCGLDCDVT